MAYSVICHKYELRLIMSTWLKIWIGKLEVEDGRQEGNGRGLKKEASSTMYMSPFPKMTVNYMHCKHVLIKTRVHRTSLNYFLQWYKNLQLPQNKVLVLKKPNFEGKNIQKRNHTSNQQRKDNSSISKNSEIEQHASKNPCSEIKSLRKLKW